MKSTWLRCVTVLIVSCSVVSLDTRVNAISKLTQKQSTKRKPVTTSGKPSPPAIAVQKLNEIRYNEKLSSIEICHQLQAHVSKYPSLATNYTGNRGTLLERELALIGQLLTTGQKSLNDVGAML